MWARLLCRFFGHKWFEDWHGRVVVVYRCARCARERPKIECGKREEGCL
jgi:hypothetical protein